MKKKLFKLIFLLLIFIGVFFRIYNLTWGAPFYFHPDERNIASAISQLIFPVQLNPHFFAYGSLPIYLTLFVGMLGRGFQTTAVAFTDAIVILRIFSFLLSTGTILLVYLIAKHYWGKPVAIFAALLTTFSTGLIQFGHFGTFEMWLTFFSTLLFFLCLQYIKTHQYRFFIFSTIICGILIGIKIVSLALCILPICALCVVSLKKKITFQRILHFFLSIIFFITAILIIYLLTNPFILFDTQSFLGSMQYESSVALGTQPVFYSGEFFHTIPVVFQFLYVYPFLINPLATVAFPPLFVFLCFEAWRKKNVTYILLLITYLILFLSQAFLFVKWTRYIVPTLPFMYLIIAIACYELLHTKKNIFKGCVVIFVIIGMVFSFSYIKTVLINPDTRIAASMWAQVHIPHSAQIISEVYDLGIVPFNPYFSHITLFNFYDLDNGPMQSQLLPDVLKQADYIILPSQRILKTRLYDLSQFPQGNIFYTNLLDGSLRFKEVYQTPCDIFCNIVYLGSPAFSFEETANVFDRPEVYIFKKL